MDKGSGGEWILYSGERAGNWHINSKAHPGSKLTVQRGVPFKVDKEDLWIASLPAMSVLSEVSFTPEIIRQPSPDETYLTRWEGALLEGLAASLPKTEELTKVVEIGTGKGISLVRLLIGLSLHAMATVWSIDLKECKEAQEYVVSCQIPSWRYKLLVGDSTVIGREWENGHLDMIYFDGNHSYEGVIADIEAWYPRLKSGAVMAFHDYGNKRHQVTKAVDDAMRKRKVKRVARVGYLIAFQKVERG